MGMSPAPVAGLGGRCLGASKEAHRQEVYSFYEGMRNHVSHSLNSLYPPL